MLNTPGGYRSRSWETSSASTNPRQDRLQRDSSYGSGGSGGSGRYGGGRSYGRSISFGKDSYLSPVTAPQRKSDSYTGGILKHTTSNTNDPPVSILSRGGSAGSGGGGEGSRRQRHNTLTFGVSGEDLDRARNNIQKYTRRLSDDTRPSDHHHSVQKKTSSRYSLPDVFDSFQPSSGSSAASYYESRLDSIMVD